MKRITLILISIFVLVIGVGCAAAADLNSDSVAGTNVVKTGFDSGFLKAPVFPDHLLKVPVIGAPALGSGLGGGGNQNFY